MHARHGPTCPLGLRLDHVVQARQGDLIRMVAGQIIHDARTTPSDLLGFGKNSIFKGREITQANEASALLNGFFDVGVGQMRQ